MNLSFKPNQNQIFKYAFILILLANILGIYLVINFLNKNVFKAFNYQTTESAAFASDINMTKFDEVLMKLENKSQNNKSASDIKNIFN